ncbi:MAG: zinc ribbon domain-containing protein [Promethearchaeota archaeon]
MNCIKPYLAIILLLCSPLILNFILYVNAPYRINNSKLSSDNNIYLTQDNENFTIKTKFPKLIWIEGNLQIEIDSKVEGKIKCFFIDDKGGKYFSNIEVTKKVDTNSQQIINIITKPHLITLPGKYHFGLVISYVDENDKADQIFDKEYDAILGMGYLILYCILIIFGTAVIIILTQKPSEEEVKALTKVSQPSGLPENKIQCPDCKKIIDEGLSFCPECGTRIPDFLKFGPTSSGIYN